MKEYSEELLSRILQAGTLGYPLSKIINIFDIEDIHEFEADFYNPESPVFKAYQRGVDKSDFIIDSKLFELAKTGDVLAINKYEQRKYERTYDFNLEKSLHNK
jgi:hypothetical protein